MSALTTVHARRAAFVLDNAAYFAAARSAMARARSSILLLGWAFDPLIDLVPGTADDDLPRQIGPLLRALAATRAGIDVRVLIWKPSFPVEKGLISNARASRRFFARTPVHFHLDTTAPLGASHHTKLLVIDDAVAFCGGADMANTRWDTPEHLDHDPLRRGPTGDPYPPRHSVTCVVDGEAARALGAVARDRWRIATGETPRAAEGGDPWPPELAVDISDTPVTIARTRAAADDWPEARGNIERLLAAIAGARQFIYAENELLTAPVVRDALAASLGQANGPEVVVVTGAHAPTRISRWTMDPARDLVVRALREADRGGRLRILAPFAPGGRAIIVHSKLMIVDDCLIRIGSANLDNRSIEFDSELDLEIQAAVNTPAQAAIARLRQHTIAHFAGCARDEVALEGSLVAAIDAVNGAGRLRPIGAARHGVVSRLIARNHVGDPKGLSDVWQPWRRQT